MTPLDLTTLLVKLCNEPHEQTWLEFKPNKGTISNAEIGEYISSISNGAAIANKPFGYLVWGVQDKTHSIVGTNFHFSMATQGSQNLELWLRTLLYPKINFEVFEFEFNDMHILLIRIPAAKVEPTNFQKKPYIRIGSSKTDLRNHPNFVKQIYNSNIDWTAQTVENATLNDLDLDALKVARDKFKESNPRYASEIDIWDDAAFLDKAKITINGKITNTALLLLGKNESSHHLLPAIAQITWKLEGEVTAYEHFGMPFLLNTTKVQQQIRNVKHKFFPDNELLATTVNKYETRSILEALHNCIAHQDYSMNSRITLTEYPGKLIFSNAGSFFEGEPADYTAGNKTPERYRNPWLKDAMMNLGMIDTMGYGIYTMFLEQRKRYFPLPDYNLSEPQKVVLQIYGHEVDENYTKLLIEQQELPLEKVLLLDRVQKKLPIPPNIAIALKKEKLIAGSRGNFYVEATIAAVTNKKAIYIKNKGLNNQYYKEMILQYLRKYHKASREDIDVLLIDKLPDVLSESQKRDKIKNLLQSLSKKDGLIENSSTATKNPIWVLSKQVV